MAVGLAPQMSHLLARGSGVQEGQWFHRSKVFQSVGSLNTTRSKSASPQLSQYDVSIADARDGGSSLPDSGGHAQPETDVPPEAFPASTALACLLGFFFFAAPASLLLSHVPGASVRSSAGAVVLARVVEL